MFDHHLDSAVRAFQQQTWAARRRHRGSGNVPLPSKEASYRLGARTLIYQLSAPLYGDDVAALQTRCRISAFTSDASTATSGRRRTRRSVRSSVRSASPPTASAVPRRCGRWNCSAPRLRRFPARDQRGGVGPPLRPAAERQADRHRSGLGGADTGLRVQTPNGPVSEADILWDLASRLEGRMAATGWRRSCPGPSTPIRRGRACRDVQRLRRRSHDRAALRQPLQPRRERRGSYHFGNSHGSTLDDRTDPHRVHPARDRGPNSFCGTAGLTAVPGNCCGSPKMPTVQVDIGFISQTNPTCGCSRIRGRGTRSPKPS